MSLRDRPPRSLKLGVRQSGAPGVAQGRRSLVAAAVVLGALILALQLWLLTTALDLYLAGEGDIVWQLAVISGVFFAGGVLAWLMTRRPRSHL